MIFLWIIGLAIVAFGLELLYIKFSGEVVPAPTIPKQMTIGEGKQFRYVVMGDSTAVSQGSDYNDGYAVASARHLSQKYKVSMLNVGISGATSETVLAKQLDEARKFSPDMVLLAVGANDATKFTSDATIITSLQKIIDGLRQANPEVKIVLTGSPAMDSVSRFPFASKWIMNFRTKRVNAAITSVIEKNSLTFAPIAKETRQAFLNDPTLTAPDNFHPNARGYSLWITVINQAIDNAL